MEKFNVNMICMLLILFAGVVTATDLHTTKANSNTNEETAILFLKEVNDIFWQTTKDFRKLNEDELYGNILLREKLRSVYVKMQSFDWKNFTDPQLERQFEIILRGEKYPPLDYKYKQATHTLNTMSRERWACDIKNTHNCSLSYVPHIKSIMTNSNDLDELIYYWSEWRNKIPVEIPKALTFFVEYYQNISKPHQKPSVIWYEEYEDSNFLQILEKLMISITPIYRELHAHVRHVLRHHYGLNVINETGLIPQHLMEQVIYQAWKKNSVLKNPFPERRLPNLQSEIDNLEYNPFDLVNMSQNYFGYLGYENLTTEFMKNHFIKMESGGPDCKSRILDFGEVELNYCPKVNYKKLLQTHGDMAQVRYAISKSYISVGLNNEACPGFGSAIGEAIILSVSNPTHLQKCLGLLQEYNYDDYLNLNRLFRLALHTLLTLPSYYVHEKLWVDMIDGNIKPNQYNAHYWNLMETYTGVCAPVKTNGSSYQMPYKFYEGIIPKSRSTKKLFGEFLGYQIYRDICLNIGEYERGNAYKMLQFCDFDQNVNSGIYLRELMNAGSSKPWFELLKSLNPNNKPGLSATAFLEYYDPVLNWLVENNLQNRVSVGWKN